eukprot:UN02709
MATRGVNMLRSLISLFSIFLVIIPGVNLQLFVRHAQCCRSVSDTSLSQEIITKENSYDDKLYISSKINPSQPTTIASSLPPSSPTRTIASSSPSSSHHQTISSNSPHSIVELCESVVTKLLRIFAVNSSPSTIYTPYPSRKTDTSSSSHRQIITTSPTIYASTPTHQITTRAPTQTPSNNIIAPLHPILKMRQLYLLNQIEPSLRLFVVLLIFL